MGIKIFLYKIKMKALVFLSKFKKKKKKEPVQWVYENDE